jgi:hypothetical protein
MKMLVLLALNLFALRLVAQENGTVAGISSTLRARESRIGSGFFDWKETRLVVAGSRLSLKGGTFPTADTSFELNSKLVLMDPHLFRHEREGPSWDPVFGEFVDRLYVDSYNGTTAKVFFGELQGASASPPLGFVQAAAQDFENGYLQPLLHYLRPTWLLDQADRVQLLESNAILDGVSCDVIRVFSLKGNATVELWLDSSREHLPIRALSKYRQGDQSQVDYEYVQQDGFWVPRRWTLVFLERGELVEQIEASVVTGKINDGVTRESFEFEFPPKTLVTDRSRDGAPEVRIARIGGDRLVSEGEQRASIPYERLLATDGPEETVIPPSRPFSLYLIILPVVGLLVVFSVYLKTRIVNN